MSLLSHAAPSKWNLNSILQLIAIGAILWTGETVMSSKDRLGKIEESLAVMSTTNDDRLTQLNRIEAEMARQRDQLRDLQVEVAKLKGK